MKIAIFGIGYVGLVSAICLCELGNSVIGVDINEYKINMLNEGKSPIVEDKISPLLQKHTKLGKLKGTTDVKKAIKESEVAMICVGTPSKKNGSLDLNHVINVTKEIGKTLRETKNYTLIYRSTMLPGSMENKVIPVLEGESGKKAGEEIKIFYNPEFLREGSAIKDFFNPPKTVIGIMDGESPEIPMKIYEKIDAPLFITTLKEAEMVKYVDNIFHALKIGFANEIGRISKKIGVDSRKIMEIFSSDTKLNISPAYLKPGFAFGGSCLPKDLRAMGDFAKKNDVEIPIISNILNSNKEHINFLTEKILEEKSKKIGFLGIAFKNGTDDLRESPILEVVERLYGKGYKISIYDRFLKISNLIGKNREYIFEKIPHIANLLEETPEEVIKKSEILILSNGNEEYVKAIKKFGKGKTIYDLCGGIENSEFFKNYHGICW